MKRGIFLLIALSAILVLPLVSGEVLLGQTESVYNMGDEFMVPVTLKPNSAINDFLLVNIVCGGQVLEIYKSTENLGVGEEKQVIANVVLSKSLIGSLEGACFLEALYGGENAKSQSFEINDVINVEFDLSSKKFDPGEKVSFVGLALKSNGEPVDGFIELKIQGVDLTISRTINEGHFSFNFSLPDNTVAGQQILELRAYEKDNLGAVSNEGFVNEVVEVNQVLKGLEINIESQSVEPGEELVLSIIPYDQSGASVDEEIGLVVYEPGDFIYFKELVKTGQEIIIRLDEKDVPGYWKIEASTGDFFERKLFYVEENEEALFSLIEDTMIVTNVGNVPYEKMVEIGIGSSSEIQQIRLGIDETKKFRLKAPDGDYLVRTNDGERDNTLGNTFLTGRAISVGEIGEGFLSNGYVLSGVGLGLVLIILIFILRHVKKKGGKSKPANASIDFQGKALQDVVSKGKEESATAIALKFEEIIEPHSFPDLVKALTVAKKTGANVYIDGKFRIILFSKTLTGREECEKLAIKTAKEIEKVLDSFNRKSPKKVDFGIGVNNGKIISELKNSKFSFTSSGNIISLAKKIAGASLDKKGQVLVSDAVHRKVIGSIKTEKVDGQKDEWKVDKIPDREKHKDFVKNAGKKKK